MFVSGWKYYQVPDSVGYSIIKSRVIPFDSDPTQEWKFEERFIYFKVNEATLFYYENTSDEISYAFLLHQFWLECRFLCFNFIAVATSFCHLRFYKLIHVDCTRVFFDCACNENWNKVIFLASFSGRYFKWSSSLYLTHDWNGLKEMLFLNIMNGMTNMNFNFKVN